MLPVHVAPRSDSAFHLADWLEIELLRGSPWRVTESNLRGYLESHGLFGAFGASVPGAVMAMNRRSRRLGRRYPLEDSPGGLRRAEWDDQQLPYVALLCLSQVDYEADAGALQTAATLFEMFCELAIPDVAGGQCVHFGWPTRSGRPERFSDAIRWLATRLRLQPGAGYRDPRRRDGGADLVSWRSLSDGHTFDFRLIQCTLGPDILRKAREIDVQQWLSWIDFHETPRVSLALPYQVTSRSVEMREAQRLGTLVLDRPRLVDAALERGEPLMLLCRQVCAATGLPQTGDATQRGG